MSTPIKYLKDENGNTISPAVSVDSIFTEEGGKLVDYIYPIGSIYMSVNSTNPGTIFGGTWVAWGSGRVPVGVNTSDSNFNTVEKTGGESEHTLTVDELAQHGHTVSGFTEESGVLRTQPYNLSYPNALPDNWGNEGKILAGAQGNGWATNAQVIYEIPSHTHEINAHAAGTGFSQPHNNLQPYITCYMWKRTQ